MLIHEDAFLSAEQKGYCVQLPGQPEWYELRAKATYEVIKGTPKRDKPGIYVFKKTKDMAWRGVDTEKPIKKDKK